MSGISIKISKEQLNALSAQFMGLSDLKKKRTLEKILSKAARPIIKITKDEANKKINNTEDFKFNRKGTTYTIKAGTIKKSIGIIYHRRSQMAQISVGYRARDPYDGWFAHFVDAGTEERFLKRIRLRAKSRKRRVMYRRGLVAGTKLNPSRGSIDPRDIMPSGENALVAANEIFFRELEKLMDKI